MNSLHAFWKDITVYINSDIPFGKCVVKEATLLSRKTAPVPSVLPEFVKFKYGNVTEVVPKKRLCEGSEYFRVRFLLFSCFQSHQCRIYVQRKLKKSLVRITALHL